MSKIIDKLSNVGIEAALNVFYALLTLLIGIRITRWLIKLYKKSRLYKKLDPSIATFSTGVFRIVLDTILFITIAGIIGFPLTSIITILGSAGLAVGMALQGGLSNIAGGIIILFYKPFAVGDFIDTHNLMVY